MNYLRVLEESIGHAGTLPALLELGSNTGGTSWDLGAGGAPREEQAVSEPWRESSTSEKEERALLKLRGKYQQTEPALLCGTTF